jgi:fatty acid desaturase
MRPINSYLLGASFHVLSHVCNHVAFIHRSFLNFVLGRFLYSASGSTTSSHQISHRHHNSSQSPNMEVSRRSSRIARRLGSANISGKHVSPSQREVSARRMNY